MSLASVGNGIWNEIAETQTLKTAWAREAFALDENNMGVFEDYEYEEFYKNVDPLVFISYLDYRPLLLENVAISQYIQVKQNLELRMPLPEIISINEAVAVASMDRMLSPVQQKELRALLREDYITELTRRSQYDSRLAHADKSDADLEWELNNIDEAEIESPPNKPLYTTAEEKAELDAEIDASLRELADLLSTPPSNAPPISDQAAQEALDAELASLEVELANLTESMADAKLMRSARRKIWSATYSLMHHAFRNGHYKFRDVARFILEYISANGCDNLSSQVTLRGLRGAYMGMAEFDEFGDADMANVFDVKSKDELWQ